MIVAMFYVLAAGALLAQSIPGTEFNLGEAATGTGVLGLVIAATHYIRKLLVKNEESGSGWISEESMTRVVPFIVLAMSAILVVLTQTTGLPLKATIQNVLTTWVAAMGLWSGGKAVLGKS